MKKYVKNENILEVYTGEELIETYNKILELPIKDLEKGMNKVFFDKIIIDKDTNTYYIDCYSVVEGYTELEKNRLYLMKFETFEVINDCDLEMYYKQIEEG